MIQRLWVLEATFDEIYFVRYIFKDLSDNLTEMRVVKHWIGFIIVFPM